MFLIFFSAGLQDDKLLYTIIICEIVFILPLNMIKSLNVKNLLSITVASSIVSALVIEATIFKNSLNDILGAESLFISLIIFISLFTSIVLPARFKYCEEFKFSLSKIIRQEYSFYIINDNIIDTLDLPRNRIQAIKTLINRGKRLKFINLCLLVLILAVLISASIFVVFAGQIAGSDSQSSDSSVIITKVVETQKDLVHSLEKELEETAIKKIQSAQNKPSDKTSKDRLPSSNNNDADVLAIATHESTVKEQLAREKAELARVQSLLNKVQDSLTEQTNGKNEKTSNYILATASISRFGILVITIYLVQILVSLYRYNAQLAANYYCQSDALLLFDHDEQIISKMISSLKNQVGFYKGDSTLIEKVVEKGSDLFQRK